MLAHLIKSLKRAQFGNFTLEQIVTHMEQKLQLIGLEAHGEMQINTVSHYSYFTTLEN